jgi:hypothetical protein
MPKPIARLKMVVATPGAISSAASATRSIRKPNWAAWPGGGGGKKVGKGQDFHLIHKHRKIQIFNKG